MSRAYERKWILTEHKLPPVGEIVIVSSVSVGVTAGIYLGQGEWLHLKNGTMHDYKTFVTSSKCRYVTHWKPVPALPVEYFETDSKFYWDAYKFNGGVELEKTPPPKVVKKKKEAQAMSNTFEWPKDSGQIWDFNRNHRINVSEKGLCIEEENSFGETTQRWNLCKNFEWVEESFQNTKTNARGFVLPKEFEPLSMHLAIKAQYKFTHPRYAYICSSGYIDTTWTAEQIQREIDESNEEHGENNEYFCPDSWPFFMPLNEFYEVDVEAYNDAVYIMEGASHE